MRVPAPSSLPPPSERVRALADRLHAHVRMLADTIGPRHVGRMPALQQARDYIASALRHSGFDVRPQPYEVRGETVENLEARTPSSAPHLPHLVVGAHYDTVPGTPGANDNGTGVAALLELAAALKDEAGGALRLVAFVNEEPPWFHTPLMGSFVYAARARAEGQPVTGMIALETMGCYSDEPGSQRYPPPLHLHFPDTGHFLGAVANEASEPLLRVFAHAFQEASPLPLIGTPAPEALPGVSWSDHWAFWTHGFQALMLTDTAPFRYPHYHQASDTPDRVDYMRLAYAVEGVAAAVRTLIATPSADWR